MQTKEKYAEFDSQGTKIKWLMPGQWKVLILDDGSQKLINGVVREDDILELNVTHIERIEQRRPANKEMDAVYLLSPLPHIVDCMMADLERQRYRRTFLIWTSGWSLSFQLPNRVFATYPLINLDDSIATRPTDPTG
ncbi:MAG: hypothetical protein LQ348_004917 [Seirophora lacunosa]|nr:MAG: hypothetical protein LQ348_004917 [Seirophora lacunosa]